MHISELENMESGLLRNDRYHDIVQIHVPKGYTIPIELLNLTPYEWKDILNKAAKSHVEQIINLGDQFDQHSQPHQHSQPTHQPPHASHVVNELTVYDEQQIAEYYCLGLSSKIHPLDKKQLDKKQLDKQLDQQLEKSQDKQNQDANNLYVDIIQSYKSLQCVIC